MSRFALLVALMMAGIVIAQPARDVFPPPDVVAKTSATIHIPTPESPEWRFLLQKSIQDELALTARQKAELSLLESMDWKIAAILSDASFGLVPSAEFARAIPKARQEFLKNGLTESQQKRLRQIVFQLKEREFGAHVAFTWTVHELGLRPDQLEDVTSIKGQRVEDIAKLVIRQGEAEGRGGEWRDVREDGGDVDADAAGAVERDEGKGVWGEGEYRLFNHGCHS